MYSTQLQIDLGFMIIGGCAFGAGLLGMIMGGWLTKEGEQLNKKMTFVGAIVFVVTMWIFCLSC